MSADTDTMTGRSRPQTDPDPELVSIDESGQAFDALASKIAREVLATLYEDPGTASDVARTVDTSLQNVGYHLDRLSAAGLVETVDTWYSPKGREMDVYAPACEPLLLFAGGSDDRARLACVIDDNENEKE